VGEAGRIVDLALDQRCDFFVRFRRQLQADLLPVMFLKEIQRFAPGADRRIDPLLAQLYTTLHGLADFFRAGVGTQLKFQIREREKASAILPPR
jgi:hypothetical protein